MVNVILFFGDLGSIALTLGGAIYGIQQLEKEPGAWLGTLFFAFCTLANMTNLVRLMMGVG